MASLPPDTIQVKRKRGLEDGPIDFLKVEGHKRHRSVSGEAVWVYQRKQPTSRKNDQGSTLPVIRATEEGEEKRPIKPLRRTVSRAITSETDNTLNKDTKPAQETKTETAKVTNDSPTSTEQMRRFHLSVSNSLRLAGGSSKKRSAPAIFVERTPKKLKDHGDTITPKPIITTPVPEVQAPEPTIPPADEPVVAPPAPAREPVKYKRPGLRARTKHTTTELPKSLVQRDASVDMDQLARDMDAYTLSQISQNIAKMEQDSAQVTAAAAAAARKAKYKPKVPAQRFAERHPEFAEAERKREQERAKAAAAASMKDLDAMDTSADDDTSDDDYVMETYERVPASRLRDEAVPVSRIGLLVFDTEPDMVEFFYGEEGDSDDEFPEDEENENSENYYTADYPDEDLAWDDMWDRNPYRFVNGNASDREEFDTDDNDSFLDDVWEKARSSEGDHRDIN